MEDGITQTSVTLADPCDFAGYKRIPGLRASEGWISSLRHIWTFLKKVAVAGARKSPETRWESGEAQKKSKGIGFHLNRE